MKTGKNTNKLENDFRWYFRYDENKQFQNTNSSVYILPFTNTMSPDFNSSFYKFKNFNLLKINRLNRSRFMVKKRKITKFVNKDISLIAKVNSTNSYNSLKNELKFYDYLYHKNIVKRISQFISNQKSIIIIDFCERVDLHKVCFDFYRNKMFQFKCICNDYFNLDDKTPNNHPVRHFSENLILFFLRQIVDVMYLFKKYKITHRDIKLENIFVNKEFKCLFGDFGISRFVHEQDEYQISISGTANYKSPEQYTGEIMIGESIFEVEIFSVGCIIYKLITNKYIGPISDENIGASEIKNVLNNLDKTINETNQDYPLILAYDYKKRITIEDLKKEIDSNKNTTYSNEIYEKFIYSEPEKAFLEIQKSVRIESNESEKIQIFDNVLDKPRFKSPYLNIKKNELDILTIY